MTAEQKAEELWKKADEYVVTTGNNDCTIDAYIAGYHECEKDSEWHYVKDGDLPKEKCLAVVFSKAGSVQVYSVTLITREWIEEDKTVDIIAWKEIILPEEE